jgi:isoquinoline 1-oxidoreductase
LATDNGAVFDKEDKKNRVTYAQLAQGKKIERHATGRVAVKTPAQFKVMGKSVTRWDARSKVTGVAQFAGDVRLPDMLYAEILRPPAHNAKLTSVDVSEAGQVKGALVIHEGDFVAVVHQYPDMAELALSKIKATFDNPPADLDDKNIFDHLLKVAPEGRVVAEAGDLSKGEGDAAAKFEATYLDGYKAHAAMEPHTAVVNFDGSKATVWASSQNPFTLKQGVAKELGIAPEGVRVISPFVGGGFGGKTRNNQAIEAARLA